MLAFIPARSGSKSVPDKNIAPLCGVPLLNYTVWTALESRLFAETLVSTDSAAYLEKAAGLGIRTDYLRPAELACDDTPTWPSVMHALDWYASQRVAAFDAVMILQPTSPFRTPNHLHQALALLERHTDASCVVGVCRLQGHHPARIKKLRDGVWLEDFCVPEPDGSRRQDLEPPAYIRNGTIFLTRISTLTQQKSILGSRVAALEMPEANSINIDTPLDLLTAESALCHPLYESELGFFRDFVHAQAAAA
jgi:CMP-N-acetylneuraminic acid synthetase